MYRTRFEYIQLLHEKLPLALKEHSVESIMMHLAYSSVAKRKILLSTMYRNVRHPVSLHRAPGHLGGVLSPNECTSFLRGSTSGLIRSLTGQRYGDNQKRLLGYTKLRGGVTVYSSINKVVLFI